MKRIIVIFGIVIVILSASVAAFANEAGGVCGYAIDWWLDSNGAFSTTGTGEMWDFTPEAPAQWDQCKGELDIKIAKINSGVTSIGTYAFYSCDKMTSISIPDTVSSIGQCAFYACGNLQITVDSNNPYFSSIDGVLYNKEANTLCAYAKDNQQPNYTVPESITTISPYAFGGCSSLSIVTLPNTITEIGENAFKDCTNLSKIIYTGTVSEWNNINVEANNDIVAQKVVFPDRVYISGENNIEIGANSITQAVAYSSPVEIEYFLCTIKYPSCFKLTDYTPVDFEYVSKDTEKDDGEYTTVTFTCQYAGNALAPSDMTVTPFEMTFDIAENTPLNTYTFTFEDGTEGIDKNGFTVAFGALEAKDVSVVPKRVENIEIVGSDTVYDKAEYTAIVTPENAVNKVVEWSVSDSDVAEISQEGVLTAKKNGTVTITTKATDGSKVYTEKQVTVYAYATIDNLVSNIGDWNKEFTPEGRRYTIYVDENADTITLTPTFTGGTLLCDGAVWINGRDKEFTLDSNITTIKLNRKNVDGYEDGTYTITIVKGMENPDEEITVIGDFYGKVAITKVESDDIIRLTITPITDIDLSDMRMYIAEYDNGYMRKIHIGVNEISDDSVIVTADYPIAADYKVMLWDNMRPVIETITQ